MRSDGRILRCTHCNPYSAFLLVVEIRYKSRTISISRLLRKQYVLESLCRNRFQDPEDKHSTGWRWTEQKRHSKSKRTSVPTSTPFSRRSKLPCIRSTRHNRGQLDTDRQPPKSFVSRGIGVETKLAYCRLVRVVSGLQSNPSHCRMDLLLFVARVVLYDCQNLRCYLLAPIHSPFPTLWAKLSPLLSIVVALDWFPPSSRSIAL